MLSGTGYVTDDFGLWKIFFNFFLILMFIDGYYRINCCSSKIFRFKMLLIFLNQIKKQFILILIITNIIINSDDFIRSVIILFFSFLLFDNCYASLFSGLDFVTSIFYCKFNFNVGPGLGEIIGPDGNYKSLPDLSKWILATSMLLGRLNLLLSLCFSSHLLEKLNYEIIKKQTLAEAFYVYFDGE